MESVNRSPGPAADPAGVWDPTPAPRLLVALILAQMHAGANVGGAGRVTGGEGVVLEVTVWSLPSLWES